MTKLSGPFGSVPVGNPGFGLPNNAAPAPEAFVRYTCPVCDTEHDQSYATVAAAQQAPDHSCYPCARAQGLPEVIMGKVAYRVEA